MTAVFSEGVADELPFDGDVQRAVDNLLPCLEDVFQMPKLRPARGTAEWVTFMKQHLLECSFLDLVEFPSLANYYWKHAIKKDKRGRPILLNSDHLAWKKYSPQKRKGCHNKLKRLPQQTKALATKMHVSSRKSA